MNIGIIGTGFLGLNAFFKLHKLHHVICSVRSQESLNRLLELEIPAFILKSDAIETFHPHLDQADILIISVAPSDQSYEDTYLKLALNLTRAISKLKNLKQIIYISSTSVYKESDGNLVDESSPLNDSDEKSIILIKTEKTLQALSAFGIKVCVVRLGEIYGKERSLKQKAITIQGKTLPGDGKQKANLSHIDDIVHMIQFAIEHSLEGVYNLVSDAHPTRMELYQMLCDKYQLAMPKFDPKLPSHHGKNKEVANEKIKSQGLTLIHSGVEL